MANNFWQILFSNLPPYIFLPDLVNPWYITNWAAFASNWTEELFLRKIGFTPKDRAVFRSCLSYVTNNMPSLGGDCMYIEQCSTISL